MDYEKSLSTLLRGYKSQRRGTVKTRLERAFQVWLNSLPDIKQDRILHPRGNGLISREIISTYQQLLDMRK